MALPKLATDKETYALLHVVKKQGIQSNKSTRPPTHPNPSPIPTRAPGSLPIHRCPCLRRACPRLGPPQHRRHPLSADLAGLTPHVAPLRRRSPSPFPVTAALLATPNLSLGTQPRLSSLPYTTELPPPRRLLCSLRPRAPPLLHPPVPVRTPLAPSPATLASEVPYLPHCVG